MSWDEEFENSVRDAEDKMFKSSVWYEKYRPKTVGEMILPEHVKDKIATYLKDGGKKLPHLGLFSRTPGTGKSSLAKVIVNELKAEALWINASLDKGIDVLRTRIHQFAAQSSLRDSVKLVVMDEFDHFSKDGQAAFRGFIDHFGDNVRFIFTGNYKENIIEPLLDRLEVYDFNQFGVSQMAKPIMDRLEGILRAENVHYQREDVIKVIKANYPRIRKMIGDLGAGLEIKTDENGNETREFNYSFVGQSDKLDQLILLMKNKDINKVRAACYGLGSCDHLFGYFGEKIEQMFAESNPDAMINAIIVLAKYQNMQPQAKDKQLNALACCFELMKLM